jgi:hypothetical protein
LKIGRLFQKQGYFAWRQDKVDFYKFDCFIVELLYC